MNLRRVISRFAGFLIFAMLPISGALAENVAFAPPSESAPIIGAPENKQDAAGESVRVAQANNEARYNDPRPITIGDLYRFEDRVIARIGRAEDKLERQSDRIDTILAVLLGGFMGIIAVQLRGEKMLNSSRLPRGADKTPTIAAH